MLLVILALYFGYKKGRDSGRNGVLWAIICGATFLGVQIVVGMAVGAVMGFGIAYWGWSDSIFEDYQLLISIGALVPAIGVTLLIFKYLDRIQDAPVADEPPPPPTFNSNFGPQ